MNKDHNGIFDGTSIIKAKLLWLIHVPFIVSLPSFFFCPRSRCVLKKVGRLLICVHTMVIIMTNYLTRYICLKQKRVDAG